MVTQNVFYGLDCHGSLFMVCTNYIEYASLSLLCCLKSQDFDKSLIHGSISFASDTMIFPVFNDVWLVKITL